MNAIEKHLAQVKADALKGGKTAEEADALVAEEKARVEALQEHPLFKGLAKENKDFISERENWKREREELTPLAEDGRKFRESGKTDLEKLQARLAELEPGSARAVKLEATIKKLLDTALERVPENMRTLIPKGPLEEQLEWVNAAEAQGLFGEKKPAVGAGGFPPQDGGTVIKSETLAGGTDLNAFQKQRTALKEGKATLELG